MSTLGDTFTSELHATHLKPRGFKKTRHTFSRSHEGYTIQGSAWNNSSGPWTFYLNCGISFDSLPPCSPDRDFPRTHAWMRAQVFTTTPMPDFSFSRDGCQRRGPSRGGHSSVLRLLSAPAFVSMRLLRASALSHGFSCRPRTPEV